MKRQKKNHFPKSLAVLPQVDQFMPGEETGGGAPPVSPFDVTDFQLISSNPTSPGTIFDYTEVHLDSITGGGTIPIKEQADPERVMHVGGIPRAGESWTMSIAFSSDSGADTIGMSCISSTFAAMKSSYPGTLYFPTDPAAITTFFTVQIEIDVYETYVDVNLGDEIVKLTHSKGDSFDLFGMSFLGRSN
ncbi:MAG: hypothetical protein U0176_09760 [Bacteroidia bacterium]